MNNFDRRHMRYFVAVAEELHFGNAAQRLHMSQPPLSQQIALLEQELGVQLFNRTRRKVELTAAGQQFLSDARRLLADMDQAADRARAAAAGQSGILRVGLNYSSPISPALSAIFRHFTKNHPQVGVELHENTSAKQLDGLYHRALDVCFVWPTRDDTSPDITFHPITKDSLHLVMASDHPLATKPLTSAACLHGQTLFLTLRQTRMGFYDTLMKACRASGSRVAIRTDIIQLPFIMNIAAARQGLAFLPHFFHRIRPDNTVFRTCSFLPPASRFMPLSLAYRTNDTSPLLKGFLESARHVIKGRI